MSNHRDYSDVGTTTEAERLSARRPGGVTAIAVVTLLGSLFSLISLFNFSVLNSYILGVRAPAGVARLLIGALAGMQAFSGIGMLKQMALARKIYIFLAIFGLVNNLITTPVLLNTYHVSDQIRTSLIGGLVFGTVIAIVVLQYLVRRKDCFYR